MAGRHRAVAPNRPLSREVGRVGALLLLTTAPLVQVGTASAAEGSSGPVQERRGQADDFLGSRDDDRDSGRRDEDDDDRSSGNRSSDGGRSSEGGRSSDGRRSGTRNASSRQRDDADERDSRGRHRADDSDDDEDDGEDRGSTRARSASDNGSSRTRSAESIEDIVPSRKSRSRSTDDDNSARRSRSTDGDSARRTTRTRSVLSSDDDRPRSRTRTVRTTEDAVSTRRSRATATVSGGVPESRWDRLAQCESHQRWSANTGNGYRGGLQFSDSTWRAYGGSRYAPSAHQASREEQIAVASKVQREQGWNAWPSCSRKLGYA